MSTKKQWTNIDVHVPYKIGDIIYIKNLASRPHLNGAKVKVIGCYNINNQRYPIELLSNSNERGYVKKENLTKIKPNKLIIIKDKSRVNVSRYFSTKIMKSNENLLNSELLKDIEIFKKNCIYIRKFYDTKKSDIIYNKLLNELNIKIKNKEIKLNKKSQMAFYSKHNDNISNKNKIGNNMYYNTFFSSTFYEIIMDLSQYFDCKYYVTLLNYYGNGDIMIPFHSDGLNHGHNNITIGISFGFERNLTFKHNKSLQQFEIPQKNGDLFAFTNKVNNKFKHAVLPITNKKHLVKPRFSIIIFGKRTKSHSRNSGHGEKMFHSKLT